MLGVWEFTWFALRFTRFTWLGIWEFGSFTWFCAVHTCVLRGSHGWGLEFKILKGRFT